MIPFVDLKAQYQEIKEEIGRAVLNVIHDSVYIGGKYVKEFEDAYAQYCGAKYCIGVGNGTDAIYIALKALGIGKGDEVVTVANTFIATSEAITRTGARVIFIDCAPDTYLMDMEAVRKSITEKTKAVIPVHLYGCPVNMSSLLKLAKEKNLFVIEDAAQAHGAEFDGRRAGTFGHAGCFSFYPGKNLGAYGDAGCIVTNDENLATAVRMFANHGRVSKYDHELEGINSRLDGLQAAILNVKLRYLEDWTQKRRAVAAMYTKLLDGCSIITPIELKNCKHVYHLYVIRIPEYRDQVRLKLDEYGISTGIHYPIPLHELKAYKYLGHAPEDFPVASQYAKEILSLPIFPELTEETVRYVCERLKFDLSSLEA